MYKVPICLWFVENIHLVTNSEILVDNDCEEDVIKIIVTRVNSKNKL